MSVCMYVSGPQWGAPTWGSLAKSATHINVNEQKHIKSFTRTNEKDSWLPKLQQSMTITKTDFKNYKTYNINQPKQTNSVTHIQNLTNMCMHLHLVFIVSTWDTFPLGMLPTWDINWKCDPVTATSYHRGPPWEAPPELNINMNVYCKFHMYPLGNKWRTPTWGAWCTHQQQQDNNRNQ